MNGVSFAGRRVDLSRSGSSERRASVALSNLDPPGSYVRDRYEQGVRRLGPGDRRVFELQRASIDKALDALGALAGTPRLRDDPFASG